MKVTLKSRESMVVPGTRRIVNTGKQDVTLLVLKEKDPPVEIDRTPYPLPQNKNASAVERN